MEQPAPARSHPLHRAGGQALDHLPLQEQGDEQNGQRGHHDYSAHLAPQNTAVLAEQAERYRQCLAAGVGQDHRK